MPSGSSMRAWCIVITSRASDGTSGLSEPDLALRFRQKALLDTALFDYLFLLVRLCLQKTYLSLDFEKLFGIKFDTDRRKDDVSDKKNKLRRLLLTPQLDWRKIRHTPQSVGRTALNNLFRTVLEVVFVGIKNNISNAREVHKHSESIYYLYSFFRPLAQDILLELSKFVIFSNDSVNWGLLDSKLDRQGRDDRRATRQLRRPAHGLQDA